MNTAMFFRRPKHSSKQTLYQAEEARLKKLSRRIDRKLRSQLAHRRLRRMLRPMRSNRESGRPVPLWIPSRWSLSLALATWLLLLWLGIRLPIDIGHWPAWSALLGIGLASLFELWLLPRLSALPYRFCLMRLEHRSDDHPSTDLYIRARRRDSRTGFGWTRWDRVRAVEPGDIVAAITNRQDDILAVVPLRVEGRLPVFVWVRSLYQDDVLPPLSQGTKTLAQAFDDACTQFLRIDQKAERSRALRSGQFAPPAQAPEHAWRGAILPEEVKQRLMAMAADFAAGKPSAPRGLLLYGPPGTGKTLVAKALADSIGCAFFPLTLPDLKSPYIGEGGERVKALWKKALAEPRAVIFIDECDGVFARRGGVETDQAVEEVVNAFIAEWDGFSKQTSVWVVGASNRHERIDPAVLSRFDEQVQISLPDAPQRACILQSALAELGITAEPPAAAGELSEGLSGRDLAGIAKRLARDIDAGAIFDDALLERHLSTLRRQGGTQTADAARWDTLILPETTTKELKAIAGMLAHAAAFQRRGIAIPRGLLLYGPPGTGKTQIARTLANETRLRFIAASTADIKQGWLGQSGQKVREIFERARESAPTLLFLDEIDIIAGARGGNDSFQTEIVGQLLQEMDGAKASPQHVFVLAASNRIDQIDPAVLSRLPKRIEIPLPDADAIGRLLRVMLADKPLAFDLEREITPLSARVRGWSGRDLRNWVERAEQRAVIRALENGNPESIVLQLEDFHD